MGKCSPTGLQAWVLVVLGCHHHKDVGDQGGLSASVPSPSLRSPRFFWEGGDAFSQGCSTELVMEISGSFTRLNVLSAQQPAIQSCLSLRGFLPSLVGILTQIQLWAQLWICHLTSFVKMNGGGMQGGLLWHPWKDAAQPQEQVWEQPAQQAAVGNLLPSAFSCP